MVTVSLTRCLWGLIGTSEAQIDGEPLLGTGGSWMPGQRHKNLQADLMASRECSEGFLVGATQQPPSVLWALLRWGQRGLQKGFVSRGRAGVCHGADVIRP